MPVSVWCINYIPDGYISPLALKVVKEFNLNYNLGG